MKKIKRNDFSIKTNTGSFLFLMESIDSGIQIILDEQLAKIGLDTTASSTQKIFRPN